MLLSSERDQHKGGLWKAGCGQHGCWGGSGFCPPSGQLSSPPSQPVAPRSCGGPQHSPEGRRCSPAAAAHAGALAGPLHSGLGGRARQASALAGQSARGCEGERGGGRPWAARSARFPGPGPPPPFRPSRAPTSSTPVLPALDHKQGQARGTHRGWLGAPPAGGTGRPRPAAARFSGPWPWPCSALQREGDEARRLSSLG